MPDSSSCPSCGHARQPAATDCPGCGVIFAKWRPPQVKEASAAAPPSPSPVRHIIGVVILLALGAYAWPSLKPSVQAANEDGAAGAPFEDWYPADIAPPPGTQYPCALTALPRELPGIPASHRAFINHSYSLILKATQAKLLVYNELGNQPPSNVVLENYLATTRDLQRRLREERAPGSLVPFRDDVSAAMDLQMIFFTKAVAKRQAGESFDQVIGIPEGREASGRLQSAWGKMSARYPSWGQDTKDSIYHHLCALDLF